MIKAIVFDLGGVVFTSDGGSYENRELLAKEIGIDSELLHDFWFKRKNSMITGKMSEEEYLSNLISEFNLDLSLDYLKKLIRDRNELDKETVELILKLKKKYRISALTNDVKEWTDYRITKFRLNELFDFIISSSDIALAKPDKKIYEYLIKELNLKPEEILFVDNRIENLGPAAELGIKTFHFLNTGEFKDWLIKEKVLKN